MADWTQDKLEEVVKKKHGEAEKKKPKTDIVCFIIINNYFSELSQLYLVLWIALNWLPWLSDLSS